MRRPGFLLLITLAWSILTCYWGKSPKSHAISPKEANPSSKVASELDQKPLTFVLMYDTLKE